jgi:hypothetical protein
MDDRTYVGSISLFAAAAELLERSCILTLTMHQSDNSCMKSGWVLRTVMQKVCLNLKDWKHLDLQHNFFPHFTRSMHQVFCHCTILYYTILYYTILLRVVLTSTTEYCACALGYDHTLWHGAGWTWPGLTTHYIYLHSLCSTSLLHVQMQLDLQAFMHSLSSTPAIEMY